MIITYYLCNGIYTYINFGLSLCSMCAYFKETEATCTYVLLDVTCDCKNTCLD
jgi:hypothetical protein